MFKIGDKVRIKCGFEYGERLYFLAEMVNCIGKFGEITDISQNIHYLVRTNDHGSWYWLPECLELVNEIHVGDVLTWDYPRNTYRALRNTGFDLWDIQCIRTGTVFLNYDCKRASVVSKYPLRNANGHFIKCDRIINAPVKAPKAPRARPIPDVIAKVPDAPKTAVKPSTSEGATANVSTRAITKPALDIRDEIANRADDKATCAFAMEYKKQAPYYVRYGGCHAQLGWCNSATGDKEEEMINIALSLMIHYKKFNDEQKKQYRLYVHYILNESPWQDMFLTKDVEEAINKGVLMNVDKNISHLVGAAMALRGASEHPRVLKPFADCIDKGYSGHVAFLTSGNITPTGGQSWPGHAVLDGFMLVDDLAKFFKEGYVQKNLPAIHKDQNQSFNYQIFLTITPKFRGHNEKSPNRMDEFTRILLVQKETGEGWNKRIIFNYEKSLVNIAEAFKKVLEN